MGCRGEDRCGGSAMTALEAIRDFCRTHCLGQGSTQPTAWVRHCKDTTCPLWPYRMGREGKTTEVKVRNRAVDGRTVPSVDDRGAKQIKRLFREGRQLCGILEANFTRREIVKTPEGIEPAPGHPVVTANARSHTTRGPAGELPTRLASTPFPLQQRL